MTDGNPLRMGKTDDEIADINRGRLRMAMAYLYDTHVEIPEAAEARGQAIRAIQRCADVLGLDVQLIHEQEGLMASERRRLSPRWTPREAPDGR